jgi:superkiller protein 3
VGIKGENIATVIPELLDQIKLGQQENQLFTATESRGIEDDVLSTLDSNIIKIYKNFKKSLANNNLLSPKDSCAEYYYGILSKSPELERLHNTMRRNYASALQDDAQQVMNQWLKSELSENYTSKKTFSQKIKSYPLYLERASELLGKNHYMYATLQARKHFFKGYILANSDRNPNRELGEEALFEFNKALEYQPDLPHAYWQMSSLYGYSFLEPDSAIIYAQKAMDLHPTWITLYTDISYLLFSKYKRLEDARPFLEKAIQVDSNSISALNTGGLFHRKNKDYQKAESNFKRIIEMDSTFAKAYINLGIIYMEQDKLDKAEQAYLKALSIDSTFTNGYINLGINYMKAENYIKAEKCFIKAIELDSTYINSYVNLGVVYKKQNKIIEAINTYDKTIELDSTFIDSYYNLGAAYSAIKDYPNSIINFKKTIELDPTDVYAHFSLGYVYSAANNPTEAEKYYKKTIELDSTVYWAYGNLAFIYQNAEKWESLRSMLEITNRLNTNKEIIPGMFGNALTHIRGNMDQAKTEIKKSIEKNPDSSDAFIYMAQWEINNDNLEKAWENLQKALKLDIEKGKLKKEYLTTQSDFEVLKIDNRWNELLIKISMRK